MSLPLDLVEMLSAFADAEVRYLVIGGHAVSLLGSPLESARKAEALDPLNEELNEPALRASRRCRLSAWRRVFPPKPDLC